MKTVKVRIAVAVNSEGNWNAAGWSGDGGSGSTEAAIGGLTETAPSHTVWVTAEVPLPRFKEIPGEVRT